METKTFTFDEIMNLDKVPRLNLINSITGFKSANLIATKGEVGTNLAIFSSVTHYGSHPPIVGFTTRPTFVSRHTYENIKETGFYTINAISSPFIKNAHETSRGFDKETSEFEACGFQEEYLNDFSVPYVQESPLKFGMKFEEEHHIKINETVLVIGKMVDLHIDTKILAADSTVDFRKSNVVCISGLDSYYSPQFIKKQPYVR